MSNFLLIDFGASRVKTAIKSGNEVLDIRDWEPAKPYDTKNRKFVVSLGDIETLFRTIVAQYTSKYNIDGIYMCSEMHGFALLNKDNNPISDYISWKDERCLNTENGQTSFEYLKSNYGDRFFEITGMKPRPCYPFYNLWEYLKSSNIKELKVISLPDWICALDGKSLNVSHITMSAGLGFYDIYKNEFSSELIKIFEEKYDVKLLFNKVCKDVAIGGYIDVNGQNIPIYSGVGDHQCAVLGAGNDENTVSLNLGTGSQVGMIDSQSITAEKRPFFDGKLMSVVTHIPSGRSFNTYVKFLSEINPDINFFEKLSQITLDELENASLNIDLAIFSSAWNFNNYGKILNINEQNLTLKNFLASLLKSYVNQYEKAIDFIGIRREKMILSGGIAIKIPIIEEYFRNKGYKTLTAQSKIDETFNGLCIIIEKQNKKEYKNEEQHF